MGPQGEPMGDDMCVCDFARGSSAPCTTMADPDGFCAGMYESSGGCHYGEGCYMSGGSTAGGQPMGGTGMEPQGEPTGGDPCMHVDCGMLSDAMQAIEPCCNGGGTAGGGGQMVCSRPLAAASAPCLLYPWVSSVAR